MILYLKSGEQMDLLKKAGKAGFVMLIFLKGDKLEMSEWIT